jgi:serine/threonine protein kinase
MIEDWTKWESLVINGVFPLRRFLGKSDHSVVFLTEHKAKNAPIAAIKLVPADPTFAETQLSRWKTVAALVHPHLIRLLDSGRCQIRGHDFLFVVMAYAEQTLAQILPSRALTPDEVRGMLLPTLDALAFLHHNNLVHGDLKPPNVLVVGDQLQLASDTIRPAVQPTAITAKPSMYDPPEAREGRISGAGDIWGVGMIIVEALTQHLPTWPDRRSGIVSLPATLAPAYVDMVRRCLSPSLANRPTIADLEAQIKLAPQASVAAAPKFVARQAPAQAAPAWKPPKASWVVPAIAVGLILVSLVWAGLRLFQSHSEPPAVASSTSQPPPQPAASAVAPSQNPQAPLAAPPAAPLPAVLHQEIPDVSRGARESIRGHIKVTVRVTVDRSGRVVGETLETRGSSRYFARLATEASRKWRFAPASDQPTRVWLLHFEFSRGGTTGHASILRP